MSNSNIIIPELTLKDKLNWTYILANAVLNFHNSIIKTEGEQSEQEIREAALCLFNSIPASWRADDQLLAQELKEAIKTRKVDVRREYCGRKVGQPRYEDEEYIEPYKLFHACVNVMDRKGLLSKTRMTEIIDGMFNDGDNNKTENIELP
jgi:hypothetical protein